MSLGIYEHAAAIERRVYLHKFASLLYRSWLDEAIDKGVVPLLGNTPYWQNRDDYSRANFTGSKRIYIDPVKKSRSANIDLANITTSRTRLAAENGDDLENVITEVVNETDALAEAIANGAKAFTGKELSAAAKEQVYLSIVAGTGLRTDKISTDDLNDDGDEE